MGAIKEQGLTQQPELNRCEVKAPRASLYEKIQNVKTALNTQGLEKGGQNKHMGYKYMGLKDFVPQLENLCKENRITPVIDFSTLFVDVVDGIDIKGSERNIATLTIYDWDSDKTIVVKTPTAHAKLQGSPSPVQELGAMQTYIRRYLLMSAFNIIENDVLEEQYGDPEQQKQSKDKKQDSKPKQEIKTISEAQILALEAYGIRGEKLKEMATYFKVKYVQEIPYEKAEAQLKALEQKMGKKELTPPPVEDDSTPYDYEGGAE